MPPRKKAATPSAAKTRAPAKPKAKMGRPSIYSNELAAEICERMARGESLKKIVSGKGMPDEWTIYHWRNTRPEFSQQYTRARQDQMHAWADEIVYLVDDAETGYKVTVPLDSPDLERIEEGGEVTFKFNRRHLEHAKAMADVRKWIMARVAPEDFGDKTTVNMNVSYEDKDDGELMAELSQAAEKAGMTPEQLVEWMAGGTVQ